MRSTSHFTFHILHLTAIHYSDEISNRQFVIDFAKVVDLIEEMDGFILLNASV